MQEGTALDNDCHQQESKDLPCGARQDPPRNYAAVESHAKNRRKPEEKGTRHARMHACMYACTWFS